MKDGGRLVPDRYMDTMLTVARIYDIARPYERHRTWEERLAAEIKYRSLRGRLRRLRQSMSLSEAHRRLSNAVLALRGKWEASEDDW